MKEEIAIVCSRIDPASLNIAERLLELVDWQGHGDYMSSGPWRLLIHDRVQSSFHGIDHFVSDLGLCPKLIIFPCRHEAKSMIPWLGGHFAGILKGENPALSVAAPWALKSFLSTITNFAPKDFKISAEATHHGPTDVETPCFFAEIGSNEIQWRDLSAGNAVAKAILALKKNEWPVFLGFGGGHYVPRQTELILDSGIAFGHLFSNYQISFLNAELMKDAINKSEATYAYIDRKSLRSEEKKYITSILNEFGITPLRGKEIRALFPLKRCL